MNPPLLWLPLTGTDGPNFFSRVKFIIEHDGDIEKNYSHVWDGIKHISYIDKGVGTEYILNKYTHLHSHTHTRTLQEKSV